MKVSSIILYKSFIPLENKTSMCQKQRDKEVAEKERLKVGFYYPVSFGYHHPLKNAWVKGKLPWLQYGFYGERLTKKNVSIEHLQPVADFKKVYSPEKAKRLATTWENVVLASNRINNLRGCEPLSSVIDYEAMGKYLQQFEGKYIEGFGTGEQYIKGILDTINRLIQQEIP